MTQIRTINIEQFTDSLFISITVRRPGNRAKVRDLGKLEEYLAQLQAPEPEATGENGETVTPAVELPKNFNPGKANGTIKITKRLLLPQQPSEGNPEPQDPFQAACKFLYETKEKLTGRFGMAMPSKIKEGLFVLRKHRPCLCGGKDPECKNCDPEKPGFIDQITEFQTQLERAQAKLHADYIPNVVSDYPGARDRARDLPVKKGGLGPLFDPNDYPSPEVFARCFGIEWNWLALGVPEDLPAKLREEAAAKLENQFAEAAEEVKNALRESFAELISHATDKLTVKPGEKPPKFHDSLIGNIAQFIEVFNARNMMGDAQLETLVNQAKQVLVGLEPDRLRKYANVKEKTREQFAAIKAQLDAMITTDKGRKFDLAED